MVEGAAAKSTLQEKSRRTRTVPAPAADIPKAKRLPPPGKNLPKAVAAAAPPPPSNRESPLQPLLAPEASSPSRRPSEAAEEGKLYPPQGEGAFGSFRVGVFYIVTSSPFDFFVLLVIITSCVVMATQSPLDELNGTQPPIYDTLELVFTYIFTTEVCLKLLGLGVSQYFSQGWNVFDCVVVGSAWARMLLPDAGNLTALRAVRVLRALRMVNRVPSLKKIIRTLFNALPELSNVAILFAGFVFICGILGVNLFAGQMHYRCTAPGSDTFTDDHDLCVADADCPGEQTCVFYETNPNFNAVSYDDVVSAWATIFQAITLEGCASLRHGAWKAARRTRARSCFARLDAAAHAIAHAMFNVRNP